jgi:flagellin
VLRGRLGAFERNTLQPNIGQLQITIENLASSESVIRDTDFAVETAELTRSQILVQAGNSILTIANAQSQNVLALLGG